MKNILFGFTVLVFMPYLHAEDLPSFVLEDVVVTATRFPQGSHDKPVNVTILSEADIRQSASKSLPELLTSLPGIMVHDFFNTNGTGATVDLRGFGVTGGQNTQVLLDGKKITDIDLSGVQWPAIPITAIDHVEILRGGGAVLYGDGATAGVINIITKSPLKLGNRFETGVGYGSYDTTDTHVAANYASGMVGLNFTSGHYDSKGYRDNNHNSQSNFYSGIHWAKEKNELWLKVEVDRQNLRLPGGRFVQPSIGLNELATNSRGTSTPLDYATRDGQQLNVGWRIHESGREWIFDFGYRQKNQTSFFDFGGFPDYRETGLDAWSFTPRGKFEYSGLWFPATLVVGVDWYRWDYSLNLSNSPLNIVRPINAVSATQENHAVYLQNTMTISNHTTLSLGFRRERFKLDAKDIFDSGAPGAAFGSGAVPSKQTENQYAYEIGLRQQLNSNSAIVARIGRNYRFANVDEIYELSPTFSREFQLLRPQTARNQEIAFEFNGKSTFFRASLFRIRVNDEIHLDAFSTGIENTNLPPSRRDGLELEGKWSLSNDFGFSASYTYLSPRFLEGVLPGSAFTATNVVIAGKTVPLVPRHKFNLNASWKIHDHTVLNTALAYVGEQFMDNDEANNFGTSIPAYAMTNLRLTHEKGPWALTASVNNLFNRKYFNYAIRSQFAPDRYSAFPLPERNAMVALTYTFK